MQCCRCRANNVLSPFTKRFISWTGRASDSPEHGSWSRCPHQQQSPDRARTQPCTAARCSHVFDERVQQSDTSACFYGCWLTNREAQSGAAAQGAVFLRCQLRWHQALARVTALTRAHAGGSQQARRLIWKQVRFERV